MGLFCRWESSQKIKCTGLKISLENLVVTLAYSSEPAFLPWWMKCLHVWNIFQNIWRKTSWKMEFKNLNGLINTSTDISITLQGYSNLEYLYLPSSFPRVCVYFLLWIFKMFCCHCSHEISGWSLLFPYVTKKFARNRLDDLWCLLKVCTVVDCGSDSDGIESFRNFCHQAGPILLLCVRLLIGCYQLDLREDRHQLWVWWAWENQHASTHILPSWFQKVLVSGSARA